jgi:hypothetical protein
MSDDPFAELDPDDAEPEDDPFERMEVDEVDIDGVWDALDAASEAAAAEPESAEPAEPESAEPTEHVVNKRTYCQRCPHFAAPPDTACTHEEATIVEALGFDEFRVRDCPMVTEDGPRFDRRK